MKKQIILTLLLLNTFWVFSQTFKTIDFGTNGKISIPSNWKIYDEEWNDDITNKAGYANSKKRTILRASDYDNSTFYLKLSTKLLDEAISNEQLKSQEFLSLLNNDLKNTLNTIRQDNTKVIIESKNAKQEYFGTFNGGSISYTYKGYDGKSRKTIIYTIIKGKSFYNLTISWDISKNLASEKILNEIKSKIIFTE